MRLPASRPLIAMVVSCGLALTAVGVGFGFAKLNADNNLTPVQSDGTVTVTLPSGQDLLYVGLLGEHSPPPFGPSQVQIVQVSSGRTITTKYDPTHDHNSPDGIGSLGLISFVIPTAGRYRVTINGPRGLRIWAGTSPGTTVRQLVPWLVTSGLGLAVLGLGIASAVTRSRGRRTIVLRASAPHGSTSQFQQLPHGRVVSWVRQRPIFKQPCELVSPLSPDEVSRRLTVNLASGIGGVFVGLSSRGKRRGRIDGDQFRIRARSGIHNSATFEFEGRIEPRGTGSRLTGRVGPNGFVPVFLFLWFGLLSVFELLFIIFALDPKSTTPPFDPLLALFPLAMMAFGFFVVVVIVAQARFAWRSTEAWLTELLAATKPDGQLSRTSNQDEEDEFRSMFRNE